MGQVFTYSPEDVFLTIGGEILEGWDQIRVTKTNPAFKVVKGIKNKNTRVQDRNMHSVIELICPLTSKINQLFSAIVIADMNTGSGRLEVSLMDTLGFEMFSSTEAFIQTPANREFSADITTRAWTIDCLDSRWSDVGSGRGGLADVFSRLSGLI